MKKLILFLIVLITSHLAATEKWDIFELEFKGPEVENPFTNVALTAEFQYKNHKFYVDGFYDGDNIYKIRFMPTEEGKWSYITQSNIKDLDNQSGEFKCTPARKGNHGPVQVRETYHFKYADGTPFYVLGTTAYAWNHQNKELRTQTIRTLKENAFNKIRMTVMPKQYSKYIQNEPPFYPFEGSKDEGWDFKRFNVKFFQHLDEQINALRKLNVEADLILFHPYDWGKWNLNTGSVEDNVLYLKYLIARLAAYRNVWWSMANEYDLMNKPDEEWTAYFKTIMQCDPYQHLCSIHNGREWYDHSKPWITHLSVQTPYLEHIQDWRELYNKPVINDEFVYEGNIPTDWGHLTPEETVNRFWTIYCRGGYASHGETYEHPENILWWSKGGKLYGKSPERLRFLLKIMKEAPVEGLIPFHNKWNKETSLYKNKEYFLFYFGNSQQASAHLWHLAKEKKYQIEIIDVWNMTIDKLDGVFSGETFVSLPQRPYIAVRVKAIQ